MLKIIFITETPSGVHTTISEFHTLKAAERAQKEFNKMKRAGFTFLAKRLYDFEEEKSQQLVIPRHDLGPDLVDRHHGVLKGGHGGGGVFQGEQQGGPAGVTFKVPVR